MASSSSSSPPPSSSSSPPPSYPRPPPPHPKSNLRDPFEEIRPKPRRNPSSPERTYFEQRSIKRVRKELRQDKSLLHGFKLQPHATDLLESIDLSSLQDAIQNYALTKNPSTKTVFDSLAYNYPNSFSFKLAKLIQRNPPPLIRTESVSLLRSTITDMRRKVSLAMLNELKEPLLHSIKVEPEQSLLPALCEIIGNVASRIYNYPLGDWLELLQYIYSCCISGDTSLQNTKGLMLLAELPVESAENRAFWDEQGNYDTLFGIILMLTDSPDDELHALAMDASMTLMGMSKNLGRPGVCDYLLPLLFEFIDRNGEEEKLVLDRVRRLVDLVTLNVGEIFQGRESDLFHCMLRLAEKEGVSEEVRCSAVVVMKELDEVNMDAMHELVKNLPQQDVKRLLVVSMEMMSCVLETTTWHEVDEKKCHELGMTETFNSGKFLLNWLSFEGNVSVVIPTALEIITGTYAGHEDWRKRHAAMIALGTVAEGQKKDIVVRFNLIEKLVLTLLDDMHPRVVWATIHAIRCLSEYKELLVRTQFHVKILNRLVTLTGFSLCPRLQAYAVITIRYLVTNCGLANLASLAEKIVTSLLSLLKDDRQRLQEEAAETLKSIALTIPATFREHHYERTIESLEAIVLANYRKPKLLLRAKCLECISSLVRKVEQDKFKGEEADDVMEALLKLYERLKDTDYLAKSLILKALDQLCRCRAVQQQFHKFIDRMMSMLLESAELDIDLKADEDDSLDDTRYLIETVRIRACNILAYCAVLSPPRFSNDIFKVSNLFVRWLDCSSFETRKACISGLPSLLVVVKLGIQDPPSQRALTALIVKPLVQALNKKDYDSGLLLSMLKSLPKCIQTSGPFILSHLIQMISEEIIRLVDNIVEMELLAQSSESDDSESDEDVPLEEIVRETKLFITVTMETFGSRFLPFVDNLMSNVEKYMDDNFPDEVKALAISVYNLILPHFTEKPTHLNKYVCFLLQVLRDANHLYARPVAAQGVGVCAMFGGARFRPLAIVSMSRLCSVIIDERFSTRTRLYDTTVAALGKICEFQREYIRGPKTVVYWMNFLPLSIDYIEAKYAHGLFARMLQRSDVHLLGENKENLPSIIAIINEILNRSDCPASEEAINQMVTFANQYGGEV